MPLGNERRLAVAARHLVPHTSGTPFARRVPDVPLNAALNETRSRPKHFSQNLVFTIGTHHQVPLRERKNKPQPPKSGKGSSPSPLFFSRSTFIESSFREVTRSAGVFFPCASQPRVSRSACTGAALLRPNLPRCSPIPVSGFSSVFAPSIHCNHHHPPLIYPPSGAPHHFLSRHHPTRLSQSRPRSRRVHAPLGRHFRRRKKSPLPRQRFRLSLTPLHVGCRSHGRIPLQSPPHREQGRTLRRRRARPLHVRRLRVPDRGPPLHHARKIRIRHRLQRRPRSAVSRNFLEKTSRALGIRRRALRSRRPLLPHRSRRRSRASQSRRHPHLRRRRTLRRPHHSRRRLHAASFPRRAQRPASRRMCRARLGLDRFSRHNGLGARTFRRQQGTLPRHRHLRDLRHRCRFLHPALGAAIHHAQPRRHHLHSGTRLRRDHFIPRDPRTPQRSLHRRRHLRPRRNPHGRTPRRPRRPRIPRTRLRRPHLFRNVVAPLNQPRLPERSAQCQSNCIPNFKVWHFDSVPARNGINWTQAESKHLSGNATYRDLAAWSGS